MIPTLFIMVLILILMEYSLTKSLTNLPRCRKRLNPYSNGILSDFSKAGLYCLAAVLILILMEYSLTVHPACVREAGNLVLILILMEYSLTKAEFENSGDYRVLILILMEYSLTMLHKPSEKNAFLS